MGYRAQGCKELNTTDHAHALSPSSPHSLRPTAHLAFEGLHVRVDNHVCLEGLFLHPLLAHSRSSPTWRLQKGLALGVKAFTAPPLC